MGPDRIGWDRIGSDRTGSDRTGRLGTGRDGLGVSVVGMTGSSHNQELTAEADVVPELGTKGAGGRLSAPQQ
ncbi:unnamed protein product [Coccothraustes coccothraustes]